jgi:tetratricopeptide (TPR) repeat protein
MARNNNIASRTSIVLMLTISGFVPAVWGQKAPTTPTAPTGPTTGPPSTNNPNVPNRTTQPSTQQQQQPYDMGQRPIFLSGKVVMDDGTPPPEAVVIERVCGGNPRPEAWTDSKGHFSFQLGQNTAMMADASVGSVGGMGFPDYNSGGGRTQQPGMNSGAGSLGGAGGSIGRDLMNCDLRASLAGYRSEVVNLAGHRMFDNPDVGTIILHRLGNVEGNTISATSLAAPKDAKKAYDKGREALKKKKPADAEKEFQKAVDAYPKYAAAWYELGMLQQDQKKFDEARQSYQKALAADAKYVKPWVQLSMLAAKDSNWKDLADASARLLKLDPVDFPHFYFLNSVANYNLKNYEAAEKSAVEAQKMDAKHRNPKIDQVLGLIMIEKHDYPAAAEQLRNYLQFAPTAPDAAQVRLQLAELDKVNGGSAKAKEEGQEQK